MTEATEVSTSWTQNAIQPYRRQALAAVLRFCLATSVTGSNAGAASGAGMSSASAELADGARLVLEEACWLVRSEEGRRVR